MAARSGRTAKEKTQSPELVAMLTAVKTATAIQKGKEYSDRQSHCLFIHGFVVATNDTLFIGCKVDGMPFVCCPHSKTLLAALERCTGAVTFTMENQTLTVTSGRLRVPVPCLDPSALSDLEPDQGPYKVDDRLKLALEKVASIVDETEERVVTRAIFLGSGLAQGTKRGHIGVQVWHGVEGLPDIALPRVSALAVAKHPDELTGLGVYDGGTATFWFGNDSFIKTRLYDERCPNLNLIFDNNANTEKNIEATNDFFEAVKTMLPFSKDSTGQAAENISFEEGKVWAGQAIDSNASLEYPECPIMDCAFNGSYLLLVRPMAKFIEHNEHSKHLFFYDGGSVRGVLMGMLHETRAQIQARDDEAALYRLKKPEERPFTPYDQFDDIPF